MRGVRATSVEPNEIVLVPSGGPRLRISVEFGRNVTATALHRLVMVRGQQGKCRVASSGRNVTWSPVGQLQPGNHMLLVSGVPSKKYGHVTEPIENPFLVVESKSRIRRNVIVESFVRLAGGRRALRRLSPFKKPRGKYHELIKARDRATGAPISLAFDASGGRIDTPSTESLVRKKRRRGTVHPQLRSKIRKVGEATRIPVAIWLKFEGGIAEEEHAALKAVATAELPETVANECNRPVSYDAERGRSRCADDGAHRADGHDLRAKCLGGQSFQSGIHIS